MEDLVIVAVNADTGEALLPAADFAPLVERITELEELVVLLRSRMAQVIRLARSPL